MKAVLIFAFALFLSTSIYGIHRGIQEHELMRIKENAQCVKLCYPFAGRYAEKHICICKDPINGAPSGTISKESVTQIKYNIAK